MCRSGRLFAVVMSVIAAAACGGGGEPDAPSLPPRSGDVWEVRQPDDRSAVPGSIVAFINGVHVMVVDGDRIYAGMTELRATAGGDGVKTIAFPSGLSAAWVPAEGGAELRFSSGERVILGERASE